MGLVVKPFLLQSHIWKGISMADQPDNLVLELLRAIRTDQEETNTKLGAMAQTASLLKMNFLFSLKTKI